MIGWVLISDLDMERGKEVIDVLVLKSIGRSLDSEGFFLVDRRRVGHVNRSRVRAPFHWIDFDDDFNTIKFPLIFSELLDKSANFVYFNTINASRRV